MGYGVLPALWMRNQVVMRPNKALHLNLVVSRISHYKIGVYYA